MNQNEYRCLDLYEAAYLIEQGIPLRDVEANSSGRRVEFIFPPEARSVAASYGEGTVNARRFSHTLRDLKIKMYAVKSGR